MAVNGPLTPNRRRDVVENNQYHQFVRRVLRAYSRRVAAGDIEAITELVGLLGEVDTAIRAAVTGLRGFGYSWADIGRRLGLTKQAVQQRWGGEPQ